jgi:hypothetical protein
MANLTPRYEGAKTGANLTGATGESNRTFTLSFSNYHSMIELLVQGAPQHEGLDYNVGSNVITFLNPIFDDYVISIRYFTTDTSAIVTSGYAYVSTTDVYRASGITSAEISAADVTNQILRAETIICRMTKNIYWKINLTAQTVTSAANTSVTQTGAGWTINDYANQYIWVYSGTGVGQLRTIVSNTASAITVDRAWTTNPSTDSLFKVFYVPTDFSPYKDEQLTGSGFDHMYLPNYPVKTIEGLAVGETPVTVTPSKLYLWEGTGRIQFKTSAEVASFSNTYPQEVDVQYWYGVDNLPYDIKRLVELHAAIQILAQQMGGTFDDPSSVVLPEASITVGQAYINIRSSLETLKEEYVELLKNVKIWPVFAY